MSQRILLILTEFPPAIGGMQTHADRLSRHLHQSGARLQVVTYRPDDPGIDTSHVDETFPFPVLRILSRISFFYNLALLRKLSGTFQPDIIYSSTVFYGVLQAFTGIPTICRSVGNDILRPWIAWPFQLGSRLAARQDLETRLYRIFRKLEKPELVELFLRDQRFRLACTSAQCAGTILANSDFTKERLLEAGVSPGRIRVLVGGVDAAAFSRPQYVHLNDLRQDLGLPVDRFLILTACRLVEKKGLDFLIHWFSGQQPQTRNWHLAIVGNGKRQRRLKQLVTKLGLSDRITFAGAVPHEKMPPWYWCSDLFVLPSTVCRNPVTGISDAETMGRVLCEANAAGTPVIASACGGIPSVITDGKNGLLFEENNPGSLSGCVTRMLADAPLRKRLVKNGLRTARDRFDWKHILQIHLEAFGGLHS